MMCVTKTDDVCYEDMMCVMKTDVCVMKTDDVCYEDRCVL